MRMIYTHFYAYMVYIIYIHTHTHTYAHTHTHTHTHTHSHTHTHTGCIPSRYSTTPHAGFSCFSFFWFSFFSLFFVYICVWTQFPNFVRSCIQVFFLKCTSMKICINYVPEYGTTLCAGFSLFFEFLFNWFCLLHLCKYVFNACSCFSFFL